MQAEHRKTVMKQRSAPNPRRRGLFRGARLGRAEAAKRRRSASVAMAVWLGMGLLASATSAAQLPVLGRGVNVLGYDPIWTDRTRARFDQEDFTTIRRGGFSNIRVNLQAFAHMDAEDHLDSNWLQTLDWVVREAENAGLAIILDEHDSGPCAQDVSACRRRLLAFWQQISERYKNAPPTVLFELLNEPSQSLTPDLWNKLLADVLALVRRTNPNRWVVIGPGNYNDAKLMNELKLPERDRNILVTFHYYEPFAFTHQGTTWTQPSREHLVGVPWGSAADRIAVERDFDTIAEQAQRRGRPILLGEFGAYDKAAMPFRVAWTATVAREAERHGMPWCYWQFDKDFIVFDVSSGTWVKPIHDALVPPP